MVRIHFLLAAVLGLGCNEKPGAEARRLSGPNSGSSSDAGALVKGSGSVIKLPALSGKPPASTSKPLTKVQFDELAKLGFEAFTTDVRTSNDELLGIRHELKNRPKIAVQVVIRPCSSSAACNPMQLDKWSKDALRKEIVLPLRDAPNLTFELGTTELEGGVKGIWSYTLGKFDGPDASGEERHQYVNAYVLYYNNSINQIRVSTVYADDALASKDALARATPREDLEKVGKALLDSYVQAWGN
jgi:hypothetical protein